MSQRRSFLLLAGLLAVAASGFLSFAAQSPRFPYALDYGEGVILDAAWRLAEGRNIYPRSLESPPYVISSYPPLFMSLQAPMTAWFGPAYWYGRAIAQLSAVAAALFAGLVAAHFAGRRPGIIAALTLLAVPFYARWAQLNRVDLPALACAWGALASLMCIRQRAVALVLSFLLMLAAGLTRQTVWVPACAAIAAHLIAERRGRWLALYALVLGASAAIAVVALQHMTGGFWFAVYSSNVPRLELAHWFTLAGALVREIPLLLLVTIVTLVAGIRDRALWAPFLAAYLAGTLLSVASAAKVGSSMNYFLELAAGCSMAVALAWSAAEHSASRRAAHWQSALAVVIAAQALWWIRINHPYRVTVPVYLHDTFSAMKAERGPVLADAAMGILPIAGHHIWIEPFKMSELSRAGLWSEQPLLDDLHAQRFTLIVVMLSGGEPVPDQWTPAMWSAIQENYRRCRDIRIDTRVLALYRPSCPTGAGQ